MAPQDKDEPVMKVSHDEQQQTSDTKSPKQAKVGVKDEGHDVTTAGGIVLSGLIADLADGDHK